MLGGYTYVVAALVFVLALAGAGYEGWHQRGRIAEAEIASIKSGYDVQLAKAETKNAQVTERVVTVYKDRIVEIQKVGPEIAHDFQELRATPCTLPASWMRLHDAATGGGSEASAGTDDAATVTCEAAIDTIRANYAASLQNSAQLEALQKWADGVSR